MATLGIKDYPAPKGVPLDYSLLSLKSIRTINKLIHYLSDNEGFIGFFKEMIDTKKISSASGKQEIEVFKDVDFFKKLKKVGVTKSDNVNLNLCNFICVDE